MDIRLNAPAVRALIADDEQFSLDLSRAVIAEIVNKLPSKLRNHIDAAIQDETLKQMRELTKEIRADRHSYQMRTVLSDKTEQAVKLSISRYVSAALEETIRKAEAEADRKIAILNNEIESRISRRIDGAINDEINKRVAARLNQVLATVSEAEGKTNA